MQTSPPTPADARNVLKMLSSRNTFQPLFRIFDLICRNSHQGNPDLQVAHFMRKLMGRKSQQELINPKEIISSKGTPTFLTASKGDSKSIKRRQLMINKHFMQGISDVLAYEEFSHIIKSNNVSITHVSVGQHFNHLNIFWTTGQIDDKNVEKNLNSMIPELTRRLIERNFMSQIPVIRFCFDRNKINEEMLDKAFKSLSSRSDPTQFVPPTKEATGYHLNNPYAPRQWAKRLVKFDAEFKEEQEARKENIFAMKINYTFDKFQAPPDMELNFAGLDYEKYINQVNERLRKVRPKTDFVADPLPPANWVDPPNLLPVSEGQRDLKSTTEYRLKAMKEFMIGNRKKKFFSRKMEDKARAQHELEVSEALEDARLRMQADHEATFEDIVSESAENEQSLWSDEHIQDENEK